MEKIEKCHPLICPQRLSLKAILKAIVLLTRRIKWLPMSTAIGLLHSHITKAMRLLAIANSFYRNCNWLCISSCLHTFFCPIYYWIQTRSHAIHFHNLEVTYNLFSIVTKNKSYRETSGRHKLLRMLRSKPTVSKSYKSIDYMFATET